VSERVGRVACVNRELWCHQPQEIDGRIIDAMYHRHVRGIRHEHPTHPDPRLPEASAGARKTP